MLAKLARNMPGHMFNTCIATMLAKIGAAVGFDAFQEIGLPL